MGTKLVELKGTWSRTNTARYEVNFLRRRLRNTIVNIGGEFDARCPQTRNQPDDGSLRGTYRVVLPVMSTSYANQNAERAARKLFEALVLQAACRPPTITVKSSRLWNDFGVDRPAGLLP